MTETEQQARYDLTLVRLRPRTVPVALERLKLRLRQAEDKGELLACLYSEIGTVNQILLLRRYGGPRALLESRATAVLDRDPLGIAEFAASFSVDMCVALPAGFVSDVACGPFFEVRTDVPRPGALGRILDLWPVALANAVPVRPVFGGYTIAGDMMRIVHIWPWSSLEQRATTTDDACHTNIWTAAPDLVLSQRAEIFRAASFSPVQ